MKKINNIAYIFGMGLVIIYGTISFASAQTTYPSQSMTFRNSLLGNIFSQWFEFLRRDALRESSNFNPASRSKDGTGGSGGGTGGTPDSGGGGGGTTGGNCASCLDGSNPQNGNCPASGNKTCNAGPNECCRLQSNGTITIVKSCGQISFPGQDCNASATCRKDDGFCFACRCLSFTSKIATPIGAIAVTGLKVGDIVWTADATGNQIVRSITKVSRVPTTNHHVVHLVLADGRTLDVSAPHPTADGRTVGSLTVGDSYDSSIIKSVELRLYKGSATYDILPAGETGYYWANGILMGSTLK